jgi:SAM-dependent methyltransferase
MSLYDTYDPFAALYNHIWGSLYSTNVLPFLDELVLQYVPENAAILDVGCGGGQLVHLLTERSYLVTGLDGSREMLNIAKQNAPTATLVHEDARYFELPPQFQAAFSMYDTLNHIVELNELTATFRNIYRALLPGGWFCFDLRMEKEFLGSWSNQDINTSNSPFTFRWQTHYDQDSRLAHWHVIIESDSNGDQTVPTEIDIFERTYTVNEMQVSLQTAGFEAIKSYYVSARGIRAGEGKRTFFVARKN